MLGHEQAEIELVRLRIMHAERNGTVDTMEDTPDLRERFDGAA